MTWPPQATRAEVLRILEVNRNNFHHWVISREETAVLIGLLRERDAEWTEYVDWLTDAMAGHYQISVLHGFHDSDELIQEGKRRRAALGYVPKSERVPQGSEGGEAE